MNEKKKLLVGIGAAVIIAAILAWVTSLEYSGRKGKKAAEQIMGAITTKEYNLNVPERKTASEYVPLDLEKIREKTKISSLKNSEEERFKVVEIKNDKGEVTARKEYKENSMVVVTNFDGKKTIFTETVKEKNGKFEGQSVIEYPDGTKQIYNYKKGIKQGDAEIQFPNGDREIYKYVKGVPSGEAVYYFANGDKEIYTYKNGVIDGEAQYIYADGRTEKYKYINGERK